MLYSTAGSRLYTADAPAFRAGAWPAAGWVEIGHVQAIGMLGAEWDVETTDAVRQSDLGIEEEVAKATLRRPELPLVMGIDTADPGQLLLWREARSDDSFPFRLVFPDGTTTRRWWALVIRIGEVFDTANRLMMLQVDLKPTSNAEAAP